MLFLASADFFQNKFFLNSFRTLSECQTVWIQIRTDSVSPDLGPNCLKRFISRHKKLLLAGNELIKVYG